MPGVGCWVVLMCVRNGRVNVHKSGSSGLNPVGKWTDEVLRCNGYCKTGRSLYRPENLGPGCSV